MLKRYIALIAAGSLVIGGGVIIVFAGRLLNWDYRLLSTCPEYVERSGSTDEEVNSIVINALNDEITFAQSSEVDEITYTVMENEYETYSITSVNGVLNIQYNWNVPWFKTIFYIPINEKSMTVTIPLDYDGGLSIELINGSIDIANSTFSSSLSSSIINGNVTLENITSTANIKASSINGAVVLNDVETTKAVTASTTNGKIDLIDVTCSDATATDINGKVTLTRVNVSNNIYSSNTNGAIYLTTVSIGNKGTFSTVNGPISGTIVGSVTDFLISSHTTNGSNNLANYNGDIPTTGTKELSFNSTNGSIAISFI